MPDIDLTAAVNAAARTAYEQDRAATKSEARKRLPDWANLTHAQRWVYLERLLPIVTAAHRDIARQAWQQGHETPRDYVVDLTLGGEDAHVIVGPPQPNPYDPENIPSEAGPHE